MMWLANMVLSAAVRRNPHAPSLEQQWKMTELNLWQWVYQKQQFQSTMRRDRICALLGLTRTEDQQIFLVTLYCAMSSNEAVCVL
jgi:Lon protease-like protein